MRPIPWLAGLALALLTASIARRAYRDERPGHEPITKFFSEIYAAAKYQGEDAQQI